MIVFDSFPGGVRQVQTSVDESLLFNPTAQTVWCTEWEGETPTLHTIAPGETLRLVPGRS
ncbi:MAG: hypothetical protein ACYTGH_14610 [Planctomycetota bacterium]